MYSAWILKSMLVVVALFPTAMEMVANCINLQSLSTPDSIHVETGLQSRWVRSMPVEPTFIEQGARLDNSVR